MTTTHPIDQLIHQAVDGTTHLIRGNEPHTSHLANRLETWGFNHTTRTGSIIYSIGHGSIIMAGYQVRPYDSTPTYDAADLAPYTREEQLERTLDTIDQHIITWRGSLNRHHEDAEDIIEYVIRPIEDALREARQ